jgi:hypothetical protein
MNVQNKWSATRNGPLPMARKGYEKRLRWFTQGKQAVETSLKIAAQVPQCYVCPLCFPINRVFLREAIDTGELTLEHVPPDALGGRELVLTCSECNKRAGAMLDHQMLTLEQMLDFGRGTLIRPARARLIMGTQVLNAKVKAVGTNVEIFGIPKANRPNIAELLEPEIQKLLHEHREEGATFSVKFDKALHYRRALVGWLRTAYLVAFALFGYRYIFDPRLIPVRRQIAESDSEHIPVFAMTLTDAQDIDRQVVLIREPKQYRSLYIQMRQHAVFLPSPEDSGALYPRLATDSESGKFRQFTYHGDILPWPREPLYSLDWLMSYLSRSL